MKAKVDSLLKSYDEVKHDLSIFMNGIADFIGNHLELTVSGDEIIHSVKRRLKDRDHLRAKIVRKQREGREITSTNFFSEFTDLAGVRILHLFQEQFASIDRVIRQRVADGDWVLHEQPQAFIWDPECQAFYEKFDLNVSQRATFYTSVHYLLRPRKDAKVCCEVQVRTLFEEIWGEVDHRINYPTPTEKLACLEQIRVLSKIVGAGSRLLDSLLKAHLAGVDSTYGTIVPQKKKPILNQIQRKGRAQR